MPTLCIRRSARRLAAAGLVSALALVACSEKERAALPRASGGASSGGASSGGAPRGGAAPTATGGALSAAGSGGVVGSGVAGDGNEGGEGGVSSEPVPPLCSPTQAWGAGQRLSVSGAGDDILASVSGDELTIAWFVADELRYADRASRDAEFGAARSVDGGERYFSGATLSSDGLTLIGVRKDGKAFGMVRRVSRAAAFAGTFDETMFAELAAAPGTFRARGPFGDPVLASDGLSLIFSNLDPASDAAPTLYEARRLGARDPWPFGSSIEGEMLFASEGLFRRPSALSADGRTLFYTDELENESRAAYRSVSGGPFETSVSLGERARAVPNGACDRLYYSAPNRDGVDLFWASRQGS